MPKSLKHIGNNSFQDCKKLNNIKLPYGLEVIDDEAFDGIEVKNIEVPNTLKYVSQSFITRDNNIKLYDELFSGEYMKKALEMYESINRE